MLIKSKGASPFWKSFVHICSFLREKHYSVKPMSDFQDSTALEVAKVGQQMMIQKKDKLLELVQLEVALGVCVHCYVL